MRKAFALIDILVATAILGGGIVLALTLMSQNHARTRRALEDFWARRILLSDINREMLKSFGALQARFGSPSEIAEYLEKTDPHGKASGIPESLYTSMKIKRDLRFFQPASMPQTGFLESTVSWTAADGSPQELTLSRLVVSPRAYVSPLNAAPGPGPARDRVARAGEPAEALEPEVEERPPTFVDQVTEMVHDANHRGQLAADVFRLVQSLRSTRAGADARYGWDAVGGLDHDPNFRLKLIDKALAGVPIPDGVYAYQFREESYSVEHHPYPFVIYDLVSSDGKPYLLVRNAPKDADGWQLEGRSAFELGYHRAGKPNRWARVWATRRRVYAFTPQYEPDGRMVPGAQQLTITTLPEPIEEEAAPQSDEVRSPGWIGEILKKLALDPVTTDKPALSLDLRRVLGA